MNAGDCQLALDTGAVGTGGSAAYDFDSFLFIGAVSPTRFSAVVFESPDAALGTCVITQIVFVPAAVTAHAALVLFGVGLLGLAVTSSRRRAADCA